MLECTYKTLKGKEIYLAKKVKKKNTKNPTNTTSTKKTEQGRVEALIVVLIILAVLMLIGQFVENATLLRFLCDAVAYLIGAGFFITPYIMLITAAYLIMKLHKSKNKKWLASLWALPFFTGAIAHIFTTPGYPEKILAALGPDGTQFISGGLIAGGISELAIKALSKPGAGVLFFALLGLNLLAFFKIKLSSVLTALSAKMEKARESAAAKRAWAREEKAAEKVAEEISTVSTATEPGPQSNRFNIDIPLSGKKSNIDIPLDDYSNQPEGVFSAPETVYEKKEEPPAIVPTTAEETKITLPKKSMTKQEVEKEISQVSTQAGTTLQAEQYIYPPTSLLKREPPANPENIEAEIRANAEKLISTLSSFGVEAWIINVTRGPVVTRYEIQLDSGIKTSRITSLSDDIALALAAQSVRIAHIPARSAVGIEVPNKNLSIVNLRDVLESKEFIESQSKATFALGKDISGKPVVSDIATLPHLLVGGTTNSGKSVCINSLLISLLYKSSPEDLRLILIDPKMVEFISYNGIPHLLIPVVTDTKKSVGALAWAVMEMMQRYKTFNEVGVRNFTDYNEKVKNEQEAAKTPAIDDDEPRLEKMPRIIIVIDELADLMLASPAEVEESICRIAQMARAAGMHLIVATQRPSADIIKGLMKANIPSRIAFSVASSLESRIILDQQGAEKLLGRGDMLYNPIGNTKPMRVQGCFVSSQEIEAVVEFIKGNSLAQYNEEVITQIDKNAQNAGKGKSRAGISGDDENAAADDFDELFDDAVEIIFDMKQASTSMLQRRLKLGFTRAGRIMDQMEQSGIVGPPEGSKPRQILISREEWAEIKYERESL